MGGLIMDPALLQKLSAATTDADRQAIVLEMSLAQLHPDLLAAVKAAAIPHWFDFNVLSALIGEEKSDQLYDELIDLSFVEHIPGRGYAVHERTRLPLLDQFWQEDEVQFRLLSGWAADYCAQKTDDSYWKSEEIYHRLISDVEVGLNRFQEMATAWANFEQSSFEDIEQVTRLAEQHILAGRLTGQTADWVYLWQARLNLLYGNTEKTRSAIGKIQIDGLDEGLKAELEDTKGDLAAATDRPEEAKASWELAISGYEGEQKTFEAFLIQEKMRANGLISIEETAVDESNKTTNPRTLKLLNNIEEAWIDGVLRQVLTTGQKGLDLPLAQERAVSGKLRINRPGTLDQALNQNGELSRLFNASGRSLLILGAPGSGKTITMLELLNELIQLARSNKDEPVPLLFNLSSFGHYDGDFISWLAEEASNQYGVSAYLTRGQLELGTKYTLLLDGLDEVPNENGERDLCVDAINDYITTHPTGLVVCSRIKDYRELESKLAIQNAVVIQPLTNGQISQTLDSVERNALNDLVQKHWRLREALRSPLLLTLFPKAVPASAAEELENSDFDSLEQWQQEIFGRYVNQVLPPKESEQSRGWLNNLANGMQKAGTTVFNIEDLQWSWLKNANGKKDFRGNSSAFLVAMICAVYGPVMALIIIFTRGFVNEAGSKIPFGLLFSTAICAMLIATARSTSRWFANTEKHYPRALSTAGTTWVLVAIFSLIIWLISASVTGSSIPLEPGETAYSLLFALGVTVSVGLNVWTSRIPLVEKIQIRRPTFENLAKFKTEFLQAWVVFSVLFLLIGPIFETGRVSVRFFLIWIFPSALITSLLCWVALASITPVEVDERHNPGEGIWGSLLSALRVTLLLAPIFLFTASVLDFAYQANFRFVFIVLATVLPVAFSWYGGITYAQHWTLRWMLGRESTLPFALPDWLDKMVNAGLLRRAGGGYIFIHRSILEFFADS